MTRKYKPAFGSVISGTLRSEDLISAFADELRACRGALPQSIARYIRSTDPDDIAETLDELIDHLQAYAPAYGYFGAHPGDGADFGFWLSEDWQQCARDNGALEVTDTADVPRAYRGEVVHINDHGNATLYYTTTRGLREIWSIV